MADRRRGRGKWTVSELIGRAPRDPGRVAQRQAGRAPGSGARAAER